MKKIIQIFITLTVILSSPFVMADWYQANGSATIVSSSANARADALEDAIYKAMNFAGADISSFSNLRPLLQQKQKEYQFTNHEVRYVLITSEKESKGRIQLTAKVDIYPSAKGCHVNQYKKTVLISQFDLVSPRQAVIGQIYDIGADFSQILQQQIKQESYSFISVGSSSYEINNQPVDVLTMIAQDKGAEYVVTGTITDLTATIEAKALQEDVINRQFAIELSIYDGKTGHNVFNKTYRKVANWPFAKTSQVDTLSARFWRSSYGEMLLRLSRNMMLDMEANLACKITLPEVVAIKGNTLTINLGRIHGVEQGDVLSLWHTGSFIDQHGLPRTQVSQSDITATVSRVYDQESELTIKQNELKNSIQIGDVLTKM